MWFAMTALPPKKSRWIDEGRKKVREGEGVAVDPEKV